MSKDEKNPNFNWDKIVSMGIEPKFGPSQLDKGLTPKIARELYVGTPPSEYRSGMVMDGMEFTSTDVKFRMKAYDRHILGWWFEEGTSLNLKIGDDNWQYTELVKVLSQKEIDTLRNWVSNENKQLLQIATEYEKYGRQIHHFLYDLIALNKTLENLDEKNQSFIMKDTNQATSLLHNRVLVEVYSECKKKENSIKLTPDKTVNDKIPDLEINGIYADVKTILITEKDKKKLLQDFAIKLRKDVIEKPKYVEQIGPKGSFFVTVWSPIINSILFAYFEGKPEFYTTIPVMEENKAIFVLPSTIAFQNQYLVFDKNKVCDIMDNLACNGYDETIEKNAVAYLKLTNIREGCPLGITGNSISFPINIA